MLDTSAIVRHTDSVWQKKNHTVWEIHFISQFVLLHHLAPAHPLCGGGG